MTEPLRVGQFAIVDHEPVDRGPNAGVFHGKGPADDRAELFILAEGTTPAGESFAGHVVSALGQAFTAFDMSLTGSLHRLFSEAGYNLRDWNARSIAQHHVSIGLTCFARRGQQACVAQAGPSAAFHLTHNGVKVYLPDEEHGRPVGAGPAVPQLTRVNLEPGDRMLLISTSALRELDDEIISGIIALPLQDVLADLYKRLQHLRHLTAILVTTAEEDITGNALVQDEMVIDATVEQPVDEGESYQPHLFIEDPEEETVEAARRQLLELRPRKPVERLVPTVSEEIPLPLRRAVGESPVAALTARSAAHAAMSRDVLNSVMPLPMPERPAWRAGMAAAEPALVGGGDGDDRRRHRRESFSRGLVPHEAPHPRPAVVTGAPPVDELAEDMRARATLSPVPATEAIAAESAASISNGGSLVRVRDNMGGRWKGNGGGGSTTARRQPPPAWVIIAGGLAFLLLIVALVVALGSFGESSGDQYASLVSEAQQDVARANGAGENLAVRREALTAAQAALLEAQELNAAGVGQDGLLASVQASLAEMDAVTEPANVETIASLEQFGDKPVSVARLNVTAETAYMLDTTGSQVIAVGLTSGEKTVVYGENKNLQHGRPIATAYLDRAEFIAPSLLVADAANTLWSYSAAAGLQPVAFTAPSGMVLTDIAVFGRDLYVLDASQAAVFRFAQASNGFTSAPVKILETADLRAARRLMVDGEIVTTDADGTVRLFNGEGGALALSAAGIDKPLVKDETAYSLTRNGDFVILDAANDRVVVLRRDGTFLRQYRHKDFDNMGAFTVREGVGYVFSGGMLRRVYFS